MGKIMWEERRSEDSVYIFLGHVENKDPDRTFTDS